MNRSKYYTPDISEFRVGFECEWYTIDNYYPFIIRIWDFEIINRYQHDLKDFRVKYLDEEDLLDLGFTYVRDSYAGYYIKDNIQLAWFYDKSGVEITERTKSGIGNKRLFSGKIKNKSELKQILKMII